MTRRRIAVVFGGRGPEHWLSFQSGLFVLLFLDRAAYDVDAVYVRQDGGFASADQFHAAVDQFFAENQVVLFKESDGLGDWRGLLRSSASTHSATFLAAAARHTWDLLFPAFDGRCGEACTFQGLAEVLGLPYAGCDFQASALTIDNLLTKKIAADAGLAVAPYREVHRDEWKAGPDEWVSSLGSALGWPMFVKSPRLGRFLGVDRADSPNALRGALDLAFESNYRVLVESEIRGTEYAVGVLGDGMTTQASVIAEVGRPPLGDIVPANLSPDDSRVMVEFAQKVFQALRMRGLARVDSFWGPRGPVVHRVNTMPGLSPHSSFVQAWSQAGVPPRQLVTRIVDLAWKGPWALSES